MQTFLPLEDLAAITTNIEIRGLRREIFSRALVPENFWMVAVYLQTFLRQQYPELCHAPSQNRYPLLCDAPTQESGTLSCVMFRRVGICATSDGLLRSTRFIPTPRLVNIVVPLDWETNPSSTWKGPLPHQLQAQG